MWDMLTDGDSAKVPQWSYPIEPGRIPLIVNLTVAPEWTMGIRVRLSGSRLMIQILDNFHSYTVVIILLQAIDNDNSSHNLNARDT